MVFWGGFGGVCGALVVVGWFCLGRVVHGPVADGHATW